MWGFGRFLAVLTGCALAPGAVFVGGHAAAASPASSATSSRGGWATAPSRTSGGRREATDHVLVRFRESTTSAQRANAAQALHGRVAHSFARVRGLTSVQLDSSTTVANAIR